MNRRRAGLGWVRDLPDPRDHLFSAPLKALRSLPPSVDLTPRFPVYDQGRIGSCTANALAGAVEFDRVKNHQAPDFVPSRLFIYYNERAIEGHVKEDSGAQIRDGVKVVSTLGAPPETAWPYVIDKFSQKPPHGAYAEAKKDLVTLYARVPQSLTQFQGCLADGYPFVFGFTVYESFESDQVAKSGIVPMPKPGEAILGGHCVVAVGYDNAKRHLIIRNSWGLNWGLGGHCLMPYEYAINPQLATDFWTIRSVKTSK